MQGALDTRAKLASPARKEDEERDEKSSQKLIGRLDRPHQQLFQQHRPDPDISGLPISIETTCGFDYCFSIGHGLDPPRGKLRETARLHQSDC